MALFKVYRGDSSLLPGGKNPTDPAKLHDGYAYFCADTGEFFIDVDLSGNGTDLKRVQLNALAATKLSNSTKTVEIDDLVLTSDTIVKYDGSLTLNGVLVGNGTDTVKVIPATLGAFFVSDTDEGPKFGVLPVAQGGLGANTLVKGGIILGNEDNPVSTLTGTGVLYATTAGAPQFGVAPLIAGGTGGNSAPSARANLEVYSKKEVDDKLIDATTVAYTFTLAESDWADDPSGGYVIAYPNTDLKCGANNDVPPEITFTSNREEYNKIDYAMAEPGVGIKFYISNIPSGDIDIIIIDHM